MPELPLQHQELAKFCTRQTGIDSGLLTPVIQRQRRSLYVSGPYSKPYCNEVQDYKDKTDDYDADSTNGQAHGGRWDEKRLSMNESSGQV